MGNSIKSESLVEKLSHFVTNLFTSSTGSVKPNSSLNPSSLFVKLLTDEDPKSLGEAVVLWSQQFAGKDLRFVFETVSDETIKTTVIHRLIAIKDFQSLPARHRPCRVASRPPSCKTVQSKF